MVCRIIVFVAELVSNQWKLCKRGGRFPTKYLKVEIFPTFLTGNLECFYISHQNESVFIFPTSHLLEVSKAGFVHIHRLGNWLGAVGGQLGRASICKVLG